MHSEKITNFSFWTWLGYFVPFTELKGNASTNAVKMVKNTAEDSSRNTSENYEFFCGILVVTCHKCTTHIPASAGNDH